MKNLFIFFFSILLITSCTDDASFNQEMSEINERNNLENNIQRHVDNSALAVLPCFKVEPIGKDVNGCCQYNITFPYTDEFNDYYYLNINGVRVDGVIDVTGRDKKYVWKVTICEETEIELWNGNTNNDQTGIWCSDIVGCKKLPEPDCCDFCLNWELINVEIGCKTYSVEVEGANPECVFEINRVIKKQNGTIEIFQLSESKIEITACYDPTDNPPFGFQVFVKNEECEEFGSTNDIGTGYYYPSGDNEYPYQCE